MSQTVRAVNGLFDWLKAEDAAPVAPSNDHQNAPEGDRVVALRKELLEAAHAQLAGAQNSQEMIALLDALRVAEAAPPPAINTAQMGVALKADAPMDDFGQEPEEAAQTATESTAAAPVTFEPAQSASLDYDFVSPGIRDLSADGWLIDALKVERTQPAAPSVTDAPFETVSGYDIPYGSVLEGDWSVQSKIVPAAPEASAAAHRAEAVIETDNRAELASAVTELAKGEHPTASPEVAPLPVSPSVAERFSSVAAPMMQAFLGGAARARAVGASGMQRVNRGMAQQRTAAQARAATREAARQQAAAEALEQLAQARAEAALHARQEPPIPSLSTSSWNEAAAFVPTTDLRLPQAPMSPAESYSPEAMDALLTIPETRWSSQLAQPTAQISPRLPEWLEEKVALHTRWLESQGSEGKRYRVGSEDFTGMNLSGLNLSQAQMRGASFAGADLSGARLEGTDFSEADLSRANMADAHAPRAIFARANLTYADLNGTQAPQANFNFADLQGAKLKDAVLDGAQMREANLQGIVAPELRLVGANLRSARLFESILPGADLRGADLRNARLERTVFIGANLAGASLKEAEILDLDYAQTDFTVALDVPQDIQLAALAAERAKLNDARTALETRFAAMQQRESRLVANLRVLEHKRHHDGQFEAQETEVIDKLSAHARWLRRGGFWWMGMVAVLFGMGWLAMSEVPKASINLPVIGLIASFGVITISLAVLSCLRIWSIRRSLDQLLRHRAAARAAIAAQAVQEAAGV